MSQQGTVLVGTPKSTFTRTISLALHELNIPFTQIDCLPKSEEAFSKGVNPFGHIPSLHIHGKSIFESSAISRYLDSLSSSFPLRPSAVDPILLDELASVAADYVFSSIEFGNVKPRIAKENENSSEEQIKEEIAAGTARADEVLEKVEKLAHPSGPFIAGSDLSWADLFLYPILADYKSVPEGNAFFLSSKTPVLSKWLNKMEERESVKRTFYGSIAYMRIKEGRKLA